MAHNYYPPPHPQMTTQTSTMAVVSLVTGIASWVILPFIGAIIAVITGHMARREIGIGMGRLTGGGMATAGLVLGYLQLGLTVLSLCVAGCFFAFTMVTAGGAGFFGN